MRLKQFKKIIANIFPPVFEPVFDRCHNLPEVAVVAETIKVAMGLVDRAEAQYIESGMRRIEELAALRAKVAGLEVRVRSLSGGGAVAVNVEELFLVGAHEVQSGNYPEKHKNKIGLIKAIRTITNMPLRDAKGLVDDVVDNGAHRAVLNGSTDALDAAERLLTEVGGIVDRVKGWV